MYAHCKSNVVYKLKLINRCRENIYSNQKHLLISKVRGWLKGRKHKFENSLFVRHGRSVVTVDPKYIDETQRPRKISIFRP